MEEVKTSEDFVKNKFQPALQIVITQFSERGLMNLETNNLKAKLKNYDIIQIIEVVIELTEISKITFVYSSENTFILSNIPENNEHLPFNEENVSNVIRSLYAS